MNNSKIRFVIGAGITLAAGFLLSTHSAAQEELDSLKVCSDTQKLILQNSFVRVIDDRIPVGEVEVRRGDHVQANDGSIGHVRGLVVDPRDHHVTHVLLHEGHLWGGKRVVIPIGVVTRLDVGIRVDLSKEQVRDLPPVELDQPE